MAIEQPMSPIAKSLIDEQEKPIEVVVMDTEPDDEGGMLIDFEEATTEVPDNIPFDANLAEYCDEQCLQKMSSELISSFLSDKNSREDWERTYIKGLDQLGLKIEDRTTPWPGACGVVHPVLTEAVVRFQSQTISEIFPNAGPVKTKIIGAINAEKEKQAIRVREYMNYLITEDMNEYRSETEKMLFNLPLAGSAFRKVYWDPNLGRPCSMFVPAEDLVVSYGAPSLEMAERITYVMRMGKNQIRKLQVGGFYLEEDLSAPYPDHGDIQEKYDDLTGDSPSYTNDDRHTLLEVHADWDLTGFEDKKDGSPTGIALPYVITIDRGSSKVLSIRRNWDEGDSLKVKKQHFVHYEYLPGLGFYGFGLIHLIGGIAKSATSLLRQLVDAGTLSNLPGGLKARGLRIKGDDSPIMPGEFRDVDVPGGAIRDNITFLPYKEPSNVLYQLLGNIVEEGRRFASITDMKVADMNQNAPVGTTLAIIERSMKVMNAIQARIHYAMKKEFKILSGIIRDYLPEDYEWEVDGNDVVKAADFSEKIDVIPVNDPNSSTMAQRIMQYQAALQLASTAPQLYELSLLHRQMLDVLGIPDADEIVPTEEDIAALDPVSENMNILNGDPVKAYIWQDHEAHIQVHMSAAEDPKIIQMIERSPKAKSIEASLSSHVMDHLGFLYRYKLEKELGAPLPPPDEPLPKDLEVRLSALVAQAAERLLGRDVAEAELEEQMEKMKDPVIQHQERELELKKTQIEERSKSDAAKIAADLEKAKMRNEIERERINTQQETAKIKSTMDMVSELTKIETDNAAESKRLSAKERDRTARDAAEGARTATKFVEVAAKLVKESSGDK